MSSNQSMAGWHTLRRMCGTMLRHDAGRECVCQSRLPVDLDVMLMVSLSRKLRDVQTPDCCRSTSSVYVSTDLITQDHTKRPKTNTLGNAQNSQRWKTGLSQRVVQLCKVGWTSLHFITARSFIIGLPKWRFDGDHYRLKEQSMKQGTKKESCFFWWNWWK